MVTVSLTKRALVSALTVPKMLSLGPKTPVSLSVDINDEEADVLKTSRPEQASPHLSL